MCTLWGFASLHFSSIEVVRDDSFPIIGFQHEAATKRHRRDEDDRNIHGSCLPGVGEVTGNCRGTKHPEYGIWWSVSMKTFLLPKKHLGKYHKSTTLYWVLDGGGEVKKEPNSERVEWVGRRRAIGQTNETQATHTDNSETALSISGIHDEEGSWSRAFANPPTI